MADTWAHPDWIRNQDEDVEALLRAEAEYDDDSDILDPAFLVETNFVEDELTTRSEIQLAQGLSTNTVLHTQLEAEGEWVHFVKFVKQNRKEILGRGYETPQQCYYAYKHYKDSVRKNPGIFKFILRRMVQSCQ